MGATLIFLFISNELSSSPQKHISVFLRDFREFIRLPQRPSHRTAAEIDPARSSRDEFHPKGRKGSVVVRIQPDYSRGGRLGSTTAAFSVTTTRTDTTSHCDGKIETVEFESHESIEKRFEAEVREYLESRRD